MNILKWVVFVRTDAMFPVCILEFGCPQKGGAKSYSKTVLGCKENRRYEMGVQKIVFRGRRPRKRIF